MRLAFTSWFFSALIHVSVYSDEIDNASLNINDSIHDHDRKNTTTFSDTVFACPGLNGRYPHKEDCALFYECHFGYPHLMKCDKYKLYDDQKKQCNERCSVDCNRKDQNEKELDNDGTFKCPDIRGTFAHPTLCSKYYVCVQNISTLFKCYVSTLFDTGSLKCLERNRVNCENRLDRDDERSTVTASISTTTNYLTPTTTTTLKSSTTPSTLTSAATEPVPESTATSTDVPITVSKPTTTSIPTIAETLTTSVLLTTTTETPTTEPPTVNTTTSSFTIKITKPNTPPPTDCDEKDLDCIMDKTGNVADWFECPENGLFPHGGSHQLFIHCDNDKPYVQNCGDGTYFSPEYKVCMWIEKPDDSLKF